MERSSKQSEHSLITIGARGSPLSRVQIAEIQEALAPRRLCPIFLQTRGDRDQQASLRTTDKTDFFTREIDQLQLAHGCRLAVHSAKDLPDPLPAGLTLAALTKGVDSSDSLVVRCGENLRRLRKGARIATSSERREAAVKQLRSDLSFVDIRGNVNQRLAKLEAGEIDGLVVAEAALIRLGLTDLPRIKLPGATAPLQGQLAILARTNDLGARLLVAPLDVRRQRRVLYVGLDPVYYSQRIPQAEVFHYPLIQIVPRRVDRDAVCAALPETTHLIFTSKSAVGLFLELCSPRQLNHLRIIAVGLVTAEAIRAHGLKVSRTAREETAEGVVATLATEDLQEARCLWPHGARSRRLIADYLSVHQILYQECILYDTRLMQLGSVPSLDAIHEVVFTSPTTVESFLKAYGKLPTEQQITAQGPVTRRYLEKHAAHVDWQLSS